MEPLFGFVLEQTYTSKREIMNAKNKCSLIIGNGFDLDIGFRTSYLDFLKSKEWKLLTQSDKTKNSVSVIKFIQDEYDNNKWCDLENSIQKFAKRENYSSKPLNEEDVKHIKQEYKDVTLSMSKYLNDVVKIKPKYETSYAYKFISEYLFRNESYPLISFNYTPLDKMSQVMGITERPNYIQIHGSLKNGNPILGFEIEDMDCICTSLSFLLKSSSPDYESHNVLETLIQSNNIFIYGHSLNLIDKEYYQQFLKICTEGTENRNIIIITYDVNSDLEIRNNIRRMGINLPLLFQKTNLQFLHTKDINSSSKEMKKSKSIIELIHKSINE